MSDPKLKEAMAQIFGILKKHDIAGSVILVSQTHSEIRDKFDPSWSCASLEEVEGGHAIRFRIKKSDIPDDEQRHKRTGRDGAHSFFNERFARTKLHVIRRSMR